VDTQHPSNLLPSPDGNHAEYVRLLQWFSKKQNLRWSSFETFLESEWDGLRQHNGAGQVGIIIIPRTQWDQFSWDQRRSWKDFCQEETSAFKNHLQECKALAAVCDDTEAASTLPLNSTVYQYRQSYLILRHERLEDALCRFQRAADRFHSQSQQEQWNSHASFLKDIQYRWQTFQQSEQHLLNHHLRAHRGGSSSSNDHPTIQQV